MKIAIDIREAGHGKTGKGWYTYNLVREILKLNQPIPGSSHQSHEFILYTNAKKTSFDDLPNVTVKTIIAPSFAWHFKVLKDLKQNPPDLFFAPTSYIIPAFLPKTIRSVITVHDLVAFIFPSTHQLKATLIEKFTLRRALKKTSAVFSVSDNTKNDLRQKFNYPEEKIFLTHCAPSALFFQEIKQADLDSISKYLHLPEKFILAVGTLEPRKNFATLINSFVIVKRKHPEYKLVIVGKKGWHNYQMEALIRHHKLQREVIFTGYLADSELQKVYRLARVFVFPSIYEGFGIPPLEAMASGCPVISSNTSSLPEVVGDAGLLIEPKSAYKIADAICTIVDDEHIRTTLIDKGRVHATHFTWEESAKKAMEVFNKLGNSN